MMTSKQYLTNLIKVSGCKCIKVDLQIQVKTISETLSLNDCLKFKKELMKI